MFLVFLLITLPSLNMTLWLITTPSHRHGIIVTFRKENKQPNAMCMRRRCYERNNAEGIITFVQYDPCPR